MMTKDEILACEPYTLISFRGRVRTVVCVGAGSVFFVPVKCSWTNRGHVSYSYSEVMKDGTRIGVMKNPPDIVKAAVLEMEDRNPGCPRYVLCSTQEITAEGEQALKGNEDDNENSR